MCVGGGGGGKVIKCLLPQYLSLTRIAITELSNFYHINLMFDDSFF